MTISPSKAYLQGWEAAREGRHLLDNPYDIRAETVNYINWSRGWTSYFAEKV